MKYRIPLPGKRTIFYTVIACAVTLSPISSAWARLANWYPETPAEQVEQTETLNTQLQELDQRRESQLLERTRAEETLADLLDQLQAAESDLRTFQRPLQEVTEKLRRTQAIAMVDPLMNAEGQRQEYLRLKRETEASIRDRQERVQWLNRQIQVATQNLTEARQRMNVTLSQIDRLWKHREIINKLVFLRVVSD
ncbi:MAG: hypothetical protein HQL88_02005 [Magnetococcales bacterium]|nr:hypothetical protein [Magnetococcales bacterium]